MFARSGLNVPGSADLQGVSDSSVGEKHLVDATGQRRLARLVGEGGN